MTSHSDRNQLAVTPRLALSKTEAAASLGVSLDHFEQHVLPELRIVSRGGLEFVAMTELESWLESAGRGGHGDTGAPRRRGDRVLTVDEAAEQVQLSTRTIMRAIQSGRLAASQLNQARGGWRIYQSAIDRWLETRANVAPAPYSGPPVRRIMPGSPRRKGSIGDSKRLIP